MTPKEIVLEVVAAIFINFEPSAAEQLLAKNYVQHNPAVPTGAAPILGFIPGLKESGIEVEIHRVIAEGDLVVLHTTYTNAQAFGAEALVGFDVFRVEDGKVAEHWDNLTPVAAPNPSGHTQTNGPTEVSDLAKTAENKALVTDFVETILKKGAVDRITDFLSTETYIQHNSQISDGLEGLGAALAAMAEQGIQMVYTDLHMVVAEGDFVFTASEGALGGAPTAFFDLFRVDGGKIVEHWDVIADIPAKMAHENGKF
ncbi:nuclear transport factor 2 family protein [Aliiroseovarius sp. F20344]|uniref:nuclear transport factor 2 family protein n=1 Tax=Aliiroseovarius sp. F20344 TaxID=2926414 RepID=UPI001FF4DEFF|nr:nuclear transport factor 2 family protein [Aliiroseovarius sp. F20344]MCK0141073.1 nuclear transport factor 2 family protein [Aliiroseovarius sp. F20344]